MRPERLVDPWWGTTYNGFAGGPSAAPVTKAAARPVRSRRPTGAFVMGALVAILGLGLAGAGVLMLPQLVALPKTLTLPQFDLRPTVSALAKPPPAAPPASEPTTLPALPAAAEPKPALLRPSPAVARQKPAVRRAARSSGMSAERRERASEATARANLDAAREPASTLPEEPPPPPPIDYRRYEEVFPPGDEE